MIDDDYAEIFDDNIPLSDDHLRATAQIPCSDSGNAILATINSFPLSTKYQNGLKCLAVTWLSKDTVYAHNTSASSVMRTYHLSVIALDFDKSPKDAECSELPPFLRNLGSLAEARISRTIGSKAVDERERQYNPTQRVEQVQTVKHVPPLQEQEADEGGL